MTKEELEKEASEKYFNHKMSDFQGFYPRHYYYLGYVESAEPREKHIADLKKELEQERKINEEIKVRFVKCSSCTEEMKDKCLMFSENLCEGERCEELVDLVALVNQSELQNRCSELETENAELRKIAEFQQSSNMKRYFENKKLKEALAVGSTWSKGLNSRNKYLEEENDKYRNMVFDKMEQLAKAKEIIKELLNVFVYDLADDELDSGDIDVKVKAEQFLKENKSK